MRKRGLPAAIALAAAVIGGACGGGGGSDAEVRVFHAAIDAPPVQYCVDVCDEGAPAGAARFAAAAAYLPLSSGDHNILIRGADGRANFDLPLALEGGERRTIILRQGQGSSMQTLLLRDQRETPAAGRAVVRVVNALHLAGPLEVFLDGRSIGMSSPGDAQPVYSDVTAGSRDLRIQDARGGVVRYEARIALAERGCHSLVLTGEIDYLALAVMHDDCSGRQ